MACLAPSLLPVAISVSWTLSGPDCWAGLTSYVCDMGDICPLGRTQGSPWLSTAVLKNVSLSPVLPALPSNLTVLLFAQLNVWKSPSTLDRPVDILVPSVSLLPFKSFLKSQGLDFSVTIEDLQVGRPGTCQSCLRLSH